MADELDLTVVDDAVAMLEQAAITHESTHSSEFCEGHRSQIVAYAMLRLGLDLGHLGLVAEVLAEAQAAVVAPNGLMQGGLKGTTMH